MYFAQISFFLRQVHRSTYINFGKRGIQVNIICILSELWESNVDIALRYICISTDVSGNRRLDAKSSFDREQTKDNPAISLLATTSYHFVQAWPIHVFDSYTNLSQLKMYRSSLEEMNHILENKPRHVPLNPAPGEEMKNLERIVEYNIVIWRDGGSPLAFLLGKLNSWRTS